MNIAKIYKAYGLEENLKYSLHQIDPDVTIESNLTAVKLLNIIQKKSLIPYKHWIAVYDEYVRELDGSVAILQTPNLEEWLFDNFEEYAINRNKINMCVV